MTDLLNAALNYAKLGLPVFPCNPKDKRPLVAHGFYAATTDADQIKALWTRFTNAMIGMPTGEKSGIDVLDLDVDATKGKDGLAAIPDWATRSEVIVRTPRGGRHLWYKSNGTIRNTTDQIALGVDTRGTGGYVILPPSRNGDASYRFEKGNEKEIANLGPFPDDLRARGDW
jgi:Bifunctional DNA primase/polymerase, N-terminal